MELPRGLRADPRSLCAPLVRELMRAMDSAEVARMIAGGAPEEWTKDFLWERLRALQADRGEDILARPVEPVPPAAEPAAPSVPPAAELAAPSAPPAGQPVAPVAELGGAVRVVRGTVAADLHKMFAALYTEREKCSDAVVFVETDGTGGDCKVDAASEFVCSLHSPVLKAMLASKFQENRSRKVELQPEFVPLWPHVVRFFYGVESSISDFSSWLCLLRLADYYGISQLSAQCSANLLKVSWSAEQAVKVIDEINFDEFLVARAFSLLQDVPGSLFSTGVWRSLSKPRVAQFLSRKLRCSEKQVFDAALNWYVHSGEANRKGNDKEEVKKKQEQQQQEEKQEEKEKEEEEEMEQELEQEQKEKMEELRMDKEPEPEMERESQKEQGERDEKKNEQEQEREEKKKDEGGQAYIHGNGDAKEAESDAATKCLRQVAEPGSQKRPCQEGCREGQMAAKRRRADVSVLPEWLLSLVLFEHMDPSDLLLCRSHLPLDAYVDYLEVAAKAKKAKQTPRSERAANQSERASKRSTLCTLHALRLRRPTKASDGGLREGASSQRCDAFHAGPGVHLLRPQGDLPVLPAVPQHAAQDEELLGAPVLWSI